MAIFTVQLDAVIQTAKTAAAASAFTSGAIKTARDALTAAQSALTAASGKPGHIIAERTGAVQSAQEALNAAYSDYSSSVARFNLLIAFSPEIQRLELGEWMREVETLKAKIASYDGQHP